MRFFHKTFALFFLFLSASLSLGCSKDTAPVSKSGIYFDTAITITLYDVQDRTEGEALLKECFSLCETYESMLSRTRTDSDIYRINHAGGQSVAVSEETAALLTDALSYSRLSDGVFDCSIAPVSTLWEFQSEAPALPDPKQLQEALSHVDYRKVTVCGNRVRLEDAAMSLDLGGIAKGYIADCLKAFLQSHGISSALINLGGNILAIGSKPDGAPFFIGIQKPFGSLDDVSASVQICGQALVTSGIYERFFQKNGQIYHHLLNPMTGFPFRNGLYSVTVLSESSKDADALATSCFGLGLEKGMELIESLEHTEALFITDDYELHFSSGFCGNCAN